jgi:ribulose-phosphate 3-epimerase
VAVNPDTPIAAVESVLDQVKMVLVMTVHPGFGGQSFIPSCLPKVSQLRQLLTQKKLTVDIEVDGGIKTDNIKSLSDAGANIFVAGSAIFKSKDYTATIAQMKAVIA